MLAIMATLEDQTMLARRAEGPDAESRWEVEIQDHLTGKRAVMQFTDLQYSYLMFLTIGGGEEMGGNRAIVGAAYAELEPLFKEIPVECRPFP
jgi:hypothetical protein